MKSEEQNLELFPNLGLTEKAKKSGKSVERLNRLDLHGELKEEILPLCRLKYGEIWEDSISGHRIGVADAMKTENVRKITGKERAELVINDPPYNVKVGNANTDNLFKIDLSHYLEFSRRWVRNAVDIMDDNSHLYVWMGADYRDDYQPLPDFMIMMREFRDLRSRNFITLRNQRGYGTQRNWM